MKSVILAAVVSLALAGPVLADPCHDRFTAIYLTIDRGVPTKSFIKTEMTGSPAMANEFWYLNRDHYLTIPISPPQPWALAYQNVLYQSSDEGKTWTKVRDMDSQQNADDTLAGMKANAETIRNAVCGEDEVGGVMVDTLEADLTVSQGIVTENHYKYWIRRGENFAFKSVYDTKAPSYEMRFTQVVEEAPDLVLPVPQ